MNVELPNGVIIEDVPEGTTKEQIMKKAIAAGLATAEDFGGASSPNPEKPKEVRPETAKASDPSFEDQLMSIPGMKPLAELASAANKSVFQMLDFLGPNNVNAVLQLSGSETRVPTLEGAFANGGGYMEEGVARDAIRGLGQAMPVMAGMTPATGRNVLQAKDAAKEIVGLGTAQVTQPIKAVTKTAANAVSDALPSKAREAAKLPLYRQSGDVAAAGFKLDDAGRVVKDAVQKKALKAGIDEGAVAMLASANKATKGRVKGMIEMLEKGRSNLEFRNFNPPERIVGEAVQDRLSVIQSANKQAAKQLDGVAKSLIGKPVDVSPAVNQFLDDLANEGIQFDAAKGMLNFQGSTIEGLPKAQGIIRRMFSRLYNTADPTQNAFDVHRAKRFIDEQVSYGKTQAGLSGKMEGITKRLRHNLDSILDSNFPEYDRVNSVYAETRGVLDDVQAIAGSKVDLTADNADKALSIIAKRVLSNYASGTTTQNTLQALDDMARRYSSPLNTKLDDELFKLVSAEAEIRRMFPSAVKPNTLQGNMGMEAGRVAVDAASGNKIGLLSKGAEKLSKVFSKGDEAKIKALKELLSE